MKERTQLTHEVDENEQLRQVVASLGEIAKAQFQLLQGISPLLSSPNFPSPLPSPDPRPCSFSLSLSSSLLSPYQHVSTENGLLNTQLQQAFSKATWQADQLSDAIADSPFCSPASYSRSLPGSPRTTSSSSTNFYPKTPDYRSALVCSPLLSFLSLFVSLVSYQITSSPTTPTTRSALASSSTVKAPTRAFEYQKKKEKEEKKRGRRRWGGRLRGNIL